MPAVMTIGREKYVCREVFHNGLTCNAYAIDKLKRAFINCGKICLFASFIPLVLRKKKQLFRSDVKTALQTLKLILWRYFQATLWLVLGTSLPFILCCNIRICSDPFTFLPFGWRVSLVYSLLPILCIIVETPSKMPSYMGFFVSKAISQAWALLKYFGSVPKSIPFEKEVGLALLAGIIGLLSVKRAKIEESQRLQKIKEQAKLEQSTAAEGGPEQTRTRYLSEAAVDERLAQANHVPAIDVTRPCRPKLRNLRNVEVEFLLGSLTGTLTT